MAATDDFLKNAANLRDAVFFLASIIYVIGFVTWSFYSHYRKLGTVKALDAQYFVIGFPVAVIIILAVSITSKLVILSVFLKEYLYNLDAQYLTTIGGCSFSLLVVAVIFSKRERRLQKQSRLSFTLYMILGWFFFVIIPSPSLLITNFVLITVTVITFCIIIYIYVIKIYEFIPHVLGGGRFRTAYFDLIKETISPSLLKELVINQDSNSIVQSRDVTVVSISDNWILIRIGKAQDINAPIIEIPRTSIASIVWLTN